jgi:hypothetical protein
MQYITEIHVKPGTTITEVTDLGRINRGQQPRLQEKNRLTAVAAVADRGMLAQGQRPRLQGK